MQQFVNDLDARRGYSQNIQPIERTYSPCYKYTVGLLYSFCIKSLYTTVCLTTIRNRGCWKEKTWHDNIATV